MTSVMAIGSGLVSGHAGCENSFTVYHSGRGTGLAVAIDGPGKAHIRYGDSHDDSVKVMYTPPVPGEYRITVKYDGLSVRGSPFTVRVRGEDYGDSRSFTSTSPLTLPTRLGSYLDDHSSNQRHSTSARSASPFLRGSVSNVRVSGRGLYSGICNVQNEITVDVKGAGSGRLYWSIEGPGNVESKNHGLMDGVYRLFYRPDRSGEYRITIRYNDLEVLGSPFKVRVV